MINSGIFESQSTEIIRLAKGENDSQLSKVTQCEQELYETQVRASNIGRCPTAHTFHVWICYLTVYFEIYSVEI